jgi:2-dehydro-3-deoxy-D-arabinonate dehydratase
MALWRVQTAAGPRWAAGPVAGGPTELLDAAVRLDDLLASGAGLGAAAGGGAPVPAGAPLLAPVESQPVWAAGVTFRRSRDARLEESGGMDLYDRVYLAERPELFLKALPGGARGPGAPIGVRADSAWTVPEPELAVLVDARGDIVAVTIGDDVSSRSIEGENPLYLPQAKVYEGSCALGPCLVPLADAPDLAAMEIALAIERRGEVLFRGSCALADMRRTPAELVDWLLRGQRFPHGVVLLTGTSVVPPASVTLADGDEVRIAATGLGELRNPVVTVDTTSRLGSG